MSLNVSEDARLRDLAGGTMGTPPPAPDADMFGPDPREDEPSGDEDPWRPDGDDSDADDTDLPTLTDAEKEAVAAVWSYLVPLADGDDTDMDADDYDLCPACNGTGGGDDGSCSRCGGDGEIKR